LIFCQPPHSFIATFSISRFHMRLFRRRLSAAISPHYAAITPAFAAMPTFSRRFSPMPPCRFRYYAELHCASFHADLFLASCAEIAAYMSFRAPARDFHFSCRRRHCRHYAEPPRHICQLRLASPRIDCHAMLRLPCRCRRRQRRWLLRARCQPIFACFAAYAAAICRRISLRLPLFAADIFTPSLV
jgi:hypothetical protein